MTSSMPPDGFADEQPTSGPPDGFADQPTPSYTAKDAVGDVARPLLEGGAAAAGGFLAAPLGPVAAAGGGALGFAAGKAGADLLDRGLGRKPLLKNVSQATSETANDIYQGAQAEGSGLALSKVVPPILKAAGSARNMLGSWSTGIPVQDFQTVADHPLALVPGTLKKAGQNFGQEAEKVGISSELTPEAVDRIRSPGQYAFDTFNKLKTQGTITPQEALNARQSLDAIYPIPNQKNGSYIRMLDEIRSAFQDVITNASPGLQVASKDYAIAKAGDQFQSFLPRNKSGTPSFVRGAAMISGLAEGNPETGFMSPAVSGLGTAATGTAGSGIKSILGNPSVRRGIVGGATPLFQSKPAAKPGLVNIPDANPEQPNQPSNGGDQQEGVPSSIDKGINQGKILDETTARRFLATAKEMAGGVMSKAKDIARRLAQDAGYIVQ